MSCMDVVSDMVNSIDDVNTEIIINMINPRVRYEDVCIKPNITFEHYYASLKQKWETIINDYINKPEKCSSNTQSILMLYEVASKLNQGSNQNNPGNLLTNVGRLTPRQIEDMAYDKMIDTALNMISNTTSNNFVMDKNMVKSMKNLAQILGDNCQCQMIDIFSYILSRYKTKYSRKLAGKSRDESVTILRQDYEYIKDAVIKYGQNVRTITSDRSNPETSVVVANRGSEPVALLNFSIEDELNKLIPNELGTMKIFFVKVISRYFNNLHPIIWAQIFRGMLSNIFKDLPLSPNELFSFVSKYLLLNSGPFILKILQMIRPILSDELATKYNLTKLTYPLLEPHQIDIVLKQIVVDYDMLKITYNKSASVGHVCIGYDARKPEDKFVIKIVKPLAIAQSCWEFHVLNDLFPKGSCEDRFIKNTLRANGVEMNVANEIKNLDRSNEHYTTDYNTEFGLDIDAKLTTISHIPGIVKEGTWFGLAMTLAPGTPLSDLIENKLLENDTKFRANLHRCLDLLVTKFFYVLISQGFYHGDLHSGNVFYSFKKKQLTMIDFGAMGDIDLYSNDDTTANLLLIIIMSINYDYDGIFDVLTDILNSRCSEDKSSFIDKESDAYKQFNKELIAHKLKNMLNSKKEKEKSSTYLDDVTSDKRLQDERYTDTLLMLGETSNEKEDRAPSIYDDLERTPETKETVIENRDILPVFTEILGDSESISFAGVMQLIIKYYATSGVNVAIKFAELNELQKAYALLLGVLAKTGYNSYRMSMAIKTGVLSWGHLPKLLNVGTTYNILTSYWNESSKYGDLLSLIETERQDFLARKIARSEASKFRR